jgi:hypothetical protein
VSFDTTTFAAIRLYEISLNPYNPTGLRFDLQSLYDRNLNLSMFRYQRILLQLLDPRPARSAWSMKSRLFTNFAMERGRLPTSGLLANDGSHKGGTFRALALLSIVTVVALSATGFFINSNGVVLLVRLIPCFEMMYVLLQNAQHLDRARLLIHI